MATLSDNCPASSALLRPVGRQAQHVQLARRPARQAAMQGGLQVVAAGDALDRAAGDGRREQGVAGAHPAPRVPPVSVTSISSHSPGLDEQRNESLGFQGF
ncbi:hypothetical protein [Nonomuraea rubra]|uniref:Uncharacterized protein n=1 Tax=Nonomuraea rubra TaxID=46180 RepID=A0A7X0U0N9_9ACTN|nr:hypothetical protein [Nonomuraea rubra]MBB6550738.1 hypothetical protein [Nonomuraea rubra]